jgi:hypothetical protein
MTRSLLALSVLLFLSACNSTPKNQGALHPTNSRQVILDGGWHWTPAGDASKSQDSPVPPKSLYVEHVQVTKQGMNRVGTARAWIDYGSVRGLDIDGLDEKVSLDATKAGGVGKDLPVKPGVYYFHIVLKVTGLTYDGDPFQEAFAYEWQAPQYVPAKEPPSTPIPYIRLY